MRYCWIFLLVAGRMFGQVPPKAASELGRFALPNEAGTRLISIAGMPEPTKVRKALCSDGSDVTVRFERKQAARTDDGERQVPRRFDRLAGDVFRVIRGKAGDSTSCFLLGGGWLSAATVLAVKPAEKEGACGGSVERRLAAARGRAVAHCFLLGRMEGEGRILLAEFARNGNDALASVVLMDGSRVLYGDFPAKFRGEGEDLWRVDDGGHLSADGFHVVFVIQRGDRYALAVSWAGTEGQALTLFVSGTGNAFNRGVEDYWYQAPE